MITRVEMKRELFGLEISQQNTDGFFSATDLVRAGNKWRSNNGLSHFEVSDYWKQKSTKEFISEVEKKYGKVVFASRGRGNHTWVHPLVFIDMALWLSPTLKVEVYEWIFDNLIKFRNDSGDSYKEVCAAVYKRCSLNQFKDIVQTMAIQIREAIGVNDWQHATEEQLKKRDKVHNAIILYSNVLNDADSIIRLGLLEANK